MRKNCVGLGEQFSLEEEIYGGHSSNWKVQTGTVEQIHKGNLKHFKMEILGGKYFRVKEKGEDIVDVLSANDSFYDCASSLEGWDGHF